jgi:hypothetical protein
MLVNEYENPGAKVEVVLTDEGVTMVIWAYIANDCQLVPL